MRSARGFRAGSSSASGQMADVPPGVGQMRDDRISSYLVLHEPERASQPWMRAVASALRFSEELVIADAASRDGTWEAFDAARPTFCDERRDAVEEVVIESCLS